MFPEPTELLLVGHLIESIWTPKSKSNTLTPKTNSQTHWPRETSHVMNGIIFCVCLTLAISVLQIVLIRWRNDFNKIQEKSESQQNRDLWWILLPGRRRSYRPQLQWALDISRDGVTRTAAESATKEHSDQCSYDSNSDYKQFDWTLQIRNWRGNCRRQTSNSVDHWLKFWHRTPTHTACTDVHSVSAHHPAQSHHFSSREHAWLKFKDLCAKNILSSTRHVSFFAAPDTDHQHKFSLACLSKFAVILFFTPKLVVTIHQNTVTIQSGVAVPRISHLPRKFLVDRNHAEYLRNLREENTSLARENLRHSAEIQRYNVCFGEADIETVRIQSLWEDAQNTLHSWSCSAEQVYPTGVGSGETTVLVTRHTSGNTSESTLRLTRPTACIV